MQGLATALMTTGGLLLSLACAVLLEELLVGGLFRLFFAPRPESSAASDKRFRRSSRGGAEQKRSPGRVR